ncbi:MAG: nucleotidyltransferase family protein, partial [Cyanobacteria bacterium]|nr:nucleotidyltransferase family protein [Cyanobacteriota bacterium]
MLSGTLSKITVGREIELILNLLRVPFNRCDEQRIVELLQTDLDWDSIALLAVSNSICPFLAEYLGSSFTAHVNATDIALIREESIVVQRKSMMLLAEMMRVQKTLRNEGLEFAFIKGPINALSYYDQFKLRGFRDLDVVVQKEDLPKVLKLLAGLNYKITSLPPKLAAYMTEDCTSDAYKFLTSCLAEVDVRGCNEMAIVDVHWRVFKTFPAPLTAKHVLRYLAPIKVGMQEVSTLSTEANFVLVCAHAAKHHWQKLIWLVDIAAAMDKRQFMDWQKVYAIACEWQCWEAVRATIHVVHQILQVDLPAHNQFTAVLGRGCSDAIVDRLNWVIG